jgi:hypothetical protein
MPDCNCELCATGKRIDETCKRGDVGELTALVRELWERCGDLGFDLDYHKAIQDGSWPFARECAQAIIRRVDEREKAEANKKAAPA